MEKKKISELVNQLENESNSIAEINGFEVLNSELQEMYAGSDTNYVLCGGNGYCPGK
ncbi:hypothetical protein G7050_07820 [Dysgonomonas sp. HDW5A]|uniref:hypothetical protein n=1 Tax=Dysgonomonas sp. HDW5A TaxID=2714926 RepID=UPI00140AA90F|nr:hypothetical protein [Dysgonomonas sp. HDW5A]QIK59742.1 hypothetical protein G7050_07810 [Dysgonomonas sp. HDW5A]QIK59743.1 hypothetical protein G7050_07815 [Dysgonomonas sp. HDW5A]QIK59744.1 hypothetical protein G7050_07820 [Dysgonomonas sp. HDW5A]